MTSASAICSKASCSVYGLDLTAADSHLLVEAGARRSRHGAMVDP
jgi:hypothetical protein